MGSLKDNMMLFALIFFFQGSVGKILKICNNF